MRARVVLLSGTPADGDVTVTFVQRVAAVRDLLAAVVEALEVPLPGILPEDVDGYHLLMERRMTSVRVTLAVLLDHPGDDLAVDTAVLRRATAGTPITYTPFESPAQDRSAS